MWYHTTQQVQSNFCSIYWLFLPFCGKKLATLPSYLSADILDLYYELKWQELTMVEEFHLFRWELLCLAIFEYDESGDPVKAPVQGKSLLLQYLTIPRSLALLQNTMVSPSIDLLQKSDDFSALWVFLICFVRCYDC